MVPNRPAAIYSARNTAIVAILAAIAAIPVSILFVDMLLFSAKPRAAAALALVAVLPALSVVDAVSAVTRLFIRRDSSDGTMAIFLLALFAILVTVAWCWVYYCTYAVRLF